MLLKIYEKDPLVPLFVLSDKTSEQIFSFRIVLRLTWAFEKVIK